MRDKTLEGAGRLRDKNKKSEGRKEGSTHASLHFNNVQLDKTGISTSGSCAVVVVVVVGVLQREDSRSRWCVCDRGEDVSNFHLCDRSALL